MAAPWQPAGKPTPYKAVGCPVCRQTGYRGRAALYELMLLSEGVRAAVHPQLDSARLRRQAAKEGLLPLRMAGLVKVAEGVTTLEEVLRCTPGWDSSA
jgi:general secretion pathway protein E